MLCVSRGCLLVQERAFVGARVLAGFGLELSLVPKDFMQQTNVYRHSVSSAIASYD